ncbi:MAG: hypothetical protein NVS9B10_02600 [Nevskia sp.]
MNEALASPPFGLATLSNCERELIHLAGSIQPHGLLLVLDEIRLTIQQASENCARILNLGAEAVPGTPVADLGGDLDAVLHALLLSADLAEPTPLRCHVGRGGTLRALEGTAHRHPGGGLIVELEICADAADTGRISKPLLQKQMASAVQRFSGAVSIALLSDAVVQSVRGMTGYDRVMVYKFDPDGHGEIIAEARDAKLEPLLGHHYPSSDIPQRARELYVRNRVRVLVDVNYAPVPIVPRSRPGGGELDMSLCSLRSMSPLHLQYLKNMGVTGTLVVSLVREGRLWGLIACHHYSPKLVSYATRAVLELLGEVIATRIAAIENYVQAQVEVLVRRLELRLIEATSIDGDWRQALFRTPRNLLQPMAATGAALFYDGEIMTAGEVPSTPDLRALLQWLTTQDIDSVYASSSVVKRNPALAALAATASGVLAVPLSPSRPDYLMWFRAEQPCEYTWAGDPHKPLLNDDPLTLSPRRSFAAWSEIVRGTAAPWTHAEAVLAKAFGASLVDIIVQIQAVRLLIANHQLGLVRSQVVNSKNPVIIADAGGRILFSNESFARLVEGAAITLDRLEDLAALFAEHESTRSVLQALETERAPWRGELSLIAAKSEAMPVSMHADLVAGQGAAILGYIVILSDLSAKKQAESARRHFESSILQTERAEALLEPRSSKLLREPDGVISAILANANVAAMEISDAAGEAAVAPILGELEVSARRATALYCRLRSYLRDD